MSSLLSAFSLSFAQPSTMYDLCVQFVEDDPLHLLVEAICISIIMYLLTQRSFKTESPLTEAEVDEMVREWQPEPMIPPNAKKSSYEKAIKQPTITGKVGPRVEVDGKKIVNFTCQDYLSLNGDETIQKKALAAIDKYGCGSCGPRGFYGTIDVHLELEDKVAEFTGSERAIIYSADIATAPSTIPTFSKAGDVIVCDEGVSYIIQEGCRLSRSEVITFKHNDMKDLELKLQSVVKRDKTGKKKKLTRRFIIIEALYSNYGDIADLARIVELKEKYRFRLIMDESHSVGVLGDTGKGLVEYAGVQTSQVDMITASMANSLSSMGGFCCGSKQMVDHQRLSGAGYVFSASAPPYLCVAATEAMKAIERHPERLQTLKQRIRQLRAGLSDIVKGYHYVNLIGHEDSPIVVLSLPRGQEESDKIASEFKTELLQLGVLCAVLRNSPQEKRLVSGIKFTLVAGHSESDINTCLDAVRQAMKKVMNSQA